MLRLLACVLALVAAWTFGAGLPSTAEAARVRVRPVRRAPPAATDKVRTPSRSPVDRPGVAARLGRSRVTSSIKNHPGLVKAAGKLAGAQQAAADALVAQLAAGNLSPGIGTKRLFGSVFEARARNGARVYFRSSPGRIEILAKSTKTNQREVIEILRALEP